MTQVYDVQFVQGLIKHITHTLPLLEEKMTGLMNTVAKSAITSKVPNISMLQAKNQVLHNHHPPNAVRF